MFMNDEEEPIAAPNHAEELARAEWYGTLASLFCAPPSQELLDRIAAAGPGYGGFLAGAWGELVAVSKKLDGAAVRDEYERLFIGVGKPEVMLYGSYYLSGFLMEKPLVALRSDLSSLGLQRAEAVVESEDHIATLCEVMRYLITSNDPAHAGLSVQKRFFSDHLQPWVNTLWNVLEQRTDAAFYAPVARVARGYFEVEMQAFDLFT